MLTKGKGDARKSLRVLTKIAHLKLEISWAHLQDVMSQEQLKKYNPVWKQIKKFKYYNDERNEKL